MWWWCQHTSAYAKEPSRLDHPGVSIGVVVLMAVFGAADNHYYRKLAPNTPRYSGTTKKLTRMLTKKLTKKKEEGIPHYTSEVTPPPSQVAAMAVE